jgi:tetratricopeptide (TPR) repeat protein
VQRTTPPSHSAVEPLYRKGLWYQRHREFEQAIAMYEEVLRLVPSHRAAGAALLSATLETDGFEKACALGAQLHSTHPDDRRVALNLAVALVGCARPREALHLLDKQAALPDPHLFEIYFHKGVAYRQLGEQQQALKWYLKAATVRPNDSRLLFNLAVAFEREGDYPQALRYYRQYLAVLPAHEMRMRDRVGQRVTVIENDLLPGQAQRAAP